MQVAPPIRAVIFDVDDVLVHRIDRAGERKWETRLNLAPGALAREVYAFPTMRRAMMGLADEADAWMELACLYRLHADEICELARDFYAGERVDAEFVAFLRNLRPRFKIALLGNAGRRARAAWTTRFGLCDAVDVVVISAEEGLVKPDTRIYELAAERLGVAPGDVLFVDDAEENIAGARDAGMWATRFTCREQIIATLEAIEAIGAEASATLACG